MKNKKINKADKEALKALKTKRDHIISARNEILEIEKHEEYDELARRMRLWIEQPENYSVVHFAVEQGLSKDELLEKVDKSDNLKRAYEYTLSVQEYKIVDGALRGALDRAVALKMLEMFNGWKNTESGNNIAIFQIFSKENVSIDKIKRPDEVINRLKG